MVGTVQREKVTRATSLDQLAAMIADVERRHIVHASTSCVATALPAPLDRLACGVLHEWFAPCDDDCGLRRSRGCIRGWTAPLLLFAQLARCRIYHDNAEHSRSGLVIWIGRRIWPQPQTLIFSPADRQRTLLHRSLLIDAPSENDRLWAIDLCLRSPAAAVIVADASAMTFAHSRRLQLACESAAALALLARPAHEFTIPSAASTRWLVHRIASPTALPRWRIELARSKGARRNSAPMNEQYLVLEHDRATHCLSLPSDLADRSAETEFTSSTAPSRRIA